MMCAISSTAVWKGGKDNPDWGRCGVQTGVGAWVGLGQMDVEVVRILQT